MAEYKKVTADAVAELDSMPSGWSLTIWRAVSHPTEEGYAPPENSDNRYGWDAEGRAEYDDREEGNAKFSELRGKQAVEEFCSEHPYEGPLSPYAERIRDEPDD